MKIGRFFGLGSVFLLASALSTNANALTINLIDGGGVQTGSNAFTGFRAAADYWQSVLSDDVTLNFWVSFVDLGVGGPLGEAGSPSNFVTTSSWRTAMAGDAKTALDASVVGNLAPVRTDYVALNTATQKALGLYTGGANDFDGFISFNTSRPFDFDTRDGFQTVSSDFVAVAIHEMGHSLGFVSAVGPDTTVDWFPSNTDMFRFKDGAWDTSWGGNPYFSIDGGATEFMGNAGFAAGPDGFQTSHWREGTRIHNGTSCTTLVEPQIGIMDPTAGLCQQGIVTAQDLAIMDAMGWDVNRDILTNLDYKMTTSQVLADYFAAPVPEPATWAMMIVGFGLVGSGMRRNRTTTATA